MEDGILLKNGNETTDPRLGRIVQFDERSRNFNIRSLFKAEEHTEPRSYTWGCNQWLDQLTTSACVGFSFSHELIAAPKKVEGIDYDYAFALYKAAQNLDEWPGQNYEGTSILGGAKAVVASGKMTEYRWAFDTMDLAIAVSYFGPAVIGINWYEQMFTPDVNGFLSIGGALAGGHAILVRGFNVKKNAFKLRNSWGISWGITGDCWIRFDDMNTLLNQAGEACIPVTRIK